MQVFEYKGKKVPVLSAFLKKLHSIKAVNTMKTVLKQQNREATIAMCWNFACPSARTTTRADNGLDHAWDQKYTGPKLGVGTDFLWPVREIEKVDVQWTGLGLTTLWPDENSKLHPFY